MLLEGWGALGLDPGRQSATGRGERRCDLIVPTATQHHTDARINILLVCFPSCAASGEAGRAHGAGARPAGAPALQLPDLAPHHVCCCFCARAGPRGGRGRRAGPGGSSASRRLSVGTLSAEATALNALAWRPIRGQADPWLRGVADSPPGPQVSTPCQAAATGGPALTRMWTTCCRPASARLKRSQQG